MDFDYSDDQQLLQQSIRSLFRDKFTSEFVREFMENKQIPKELHSTLAKQGLLSIMNEGDLHSGLIYSVLISYEAGRAILPFPLLENHVVSYCFNKYVKNEHLMEELVTGNKVFTFAWRINEFSIENSGDLTGKFSFVPFANSSNYMLATVPNKKGSVQLLLVDLKSEFVKINKKDSMDETYPLFEVKLDNYPLSNSSVLFEGNEDSLLLTDIHHLASLLISGEAIGASEEMLDRTVKYTKERIQFGQPIAKFQAIKHKASQIYLLLESSRANLKYATWAMSANEQLEIKRSIPILKSYVSEAANEIIGEAIQLHGGIGFSWESDIHLYYKRARRISLMHGNTYEHREKVFENLLQQI